MFKKKGERCKIPPCSRRACLCVFNRRTVGGRSHWHAVSSAGIEISIVTISFRMVTVYQKWHPLKIPKLTGNKFRCQFKSVRLSTTQCHLCANLEQTKKANHSKAASQRCGHRCPGKKHTELPCRWQCSVP